MTCNDFYKETLQQMLNMYFSDSSIKLHVLLVTLGTVYSVYRVFHFMR